MGADADDRASLLNRAASPVKKLSDAASNNGVVRVMMAAAVASGWMFVSSLLILLNKHLLKDLKFGYPMTVAGMGMCTSGIFSYILCHVTQTIEAKAVITRSYWIKRILPVGFFMASTLWAGNLVYLYLSVSFIQMLKAFTPVITMIALFMAKLETPTYRVSSLGRLAAVTVLQLGTETQPHGHETCYT
eukprot:GHRR01019985.1.p1 GENE.GHRR01019985.1~~GHRR01019985.1.p1  ORF type:complete len:189 (+),score=38.90 GHRR01019985.1:336-902(+)